MRMNEHAMVSFGSLGDLDFMMHWFPSDINECLGDPCDTNATCHNTNGSFVCTCDNHFSGNGFNCTRLCENGYQLSEIDMICGKS